MNLTYSILDNNENNEKKIDEINGKYLLMI
jgi:hypothetical protein